MKLYYYCRAMDKTGRGMVVIHRDSCLDDLEISRATFYRYLKDSRLFRYTEYIPDSDGMYKVYYKSLKRICAEQDIENLGAITELCIKDLTFWRQLCTLAEALSLQKQSRFKAKICAKLRKENANFIDEDQLFEIVAKDVITRQASNTWDGALVTPWRIFYDAEKITPYGASLNGIAKRVTRTVRTISRRLKDFPKIHQCITRSEYHTHYSFKFIDEADIQNETQVYFKKMLEGVERVFRSYTNIYASCLDLFSMRSIRKRVKRFVYKYRGEELIDQPKQPYKLELTHKEIYYNQENLYLKECELF